MAEIWTKEHVTTRTLFIEASDENETYPLESFCRPGEDVPVVIRWEKGYALARLEIRREL